MKYLTLLALLASFSAAGQDQLRAEDIPSFLGVAPIDQPNYNPQLNQIRREQDEANEIAKERLDYQKSRDSEMDLRRALGQ